MRKRMKRLAVYLMTAVMLLSCIAVDGATAKAEGSTGTYVVNPADYTIEYLLSLYQIYIKGDVTTTNTGHQVGALVIGGNATLGNSFGNATIAPSYIKHIAVFGQTNSYYSSVESMYGEYLTNQVYYTTKADSVYLTTQPKTFSQVAGNSYIKFADAFASIESQSTAKASAATAIESSDAVTIADGYITIDLSQTPRKYVITAKQLKSAKAIRFSGTGGDVDIFRDKDNPVEISFTGCDTNDITLNFNGEAGTNEYAIGVQMDNGSGAYINMSNQLKKMSGSAESGQVSAQGLNLLWNFPDAMGNITAYYNSGHIVAPQAHVIAEGGNYEGGIIAASAYLNSEGHFYPYYEIGTATTSAEVTEIPVTKSVKKTWNDNNNRLGNRPDSVTVYLCEIVDGVPVKIEGSEKTLKEEGGTWTTADWTGLKAGTEYTVVEEDVPGYTYEVVEDGGVFEVINSTATTSITVTKVWANDGYNVNNTRQDIQATLQFESGASIDSTYLNGQNAKVTLNDSNNWTYTWTDLPAYQNKTKLSYKAIETSPPTNYNGSSSQTGNNVILTNTYTGSAIDTDSIPKTEFTVHKVWKNTGNSNPPTEAEVYLVVDGMVSETPVTLNAANSWSYTWTDLPAEDSEGNAIEYSAKEIGVPDDYTVAYSEITDNAITITNTYTPVTSKTVKKIWNDGDSSSRPTSVMVQLYADSTAYGSAVTLPQNGSWEYTWTDLPKLKTDSATEVVYTVQEVSTPDGYECTTETVGDTITLINTLKTTEEETPDPVTPVTADVTFSKTSAASTGELAGAVITLSTTDDIDLSTVTGSEIIQSKSAKSITWTSGTTAMVLSGLPAGTYTMTEVTAPTGYQKAEAITFTIDENGDVYKGGTKVTDNKITMVDAPEEGSITFSVTKQVNVESGTAPDEDFTFVLSDSEGNEIDRGTAKAGKTYTFKSITYTGPSATGTYTYTITEVEGATSYMTYDTTPKTIVVSVADGTDKLDVTVTSGSKDVTITNTYNEPNNPVEPEEPATADVTFSKKAVSADGTELEGASMKLTYDEGDNNLANVEKATNTGFEPNVTKSEDNKTITWTSNGTALELTGLPEGKYTLSEEGAPDGYKYASDITFIITADGEVTDANGNAITDNKITMVDDAIEKTTKKVTKVWDDNSDTEGKRPTSIQVQLKADGTAEGTAVTLNESNSWTYTWTDLDKTDAKGTAITYTVDEVSVPEGYSKKITTAANGDVTITNTYPAITPVTATATFSKADATTSAEVTGATITITSRDVADLSTVTKTTSSGGTGYAATEGSITWVSGGSPVVLEGLPAGTYTMKETNAPDGYKYASNITFIITDEGKVTDASGSELTGNKITMVDEAIGKVSRTVTKKWENDAASNRPASISVQLYAGETASGSAVTLNAANSWSYTWTDLAETDQNGNKIVYTISEVSVPTGYTSSTTTDATTGDFTITNTYSVTTPTAYTIVISKKAVNGTDELPGAHLKVTTDKAGTNIVNDATTGDALSWISGTTAKSVSLTEGTYYLTEIIAPDGYELSEVVGFKVKADGTVELVGTVGEANGKTVTMRDTVKETTTTATGGLKITVLDEKTNDPVPDATVEIEYPDGTKEIKKTDENGEINYPQDPGVPTGEYKITVTDVPDGYTVTTGETGKVTVVENDVVEHVAKITISEDSTSKPGDDSDDDSDNGSGKDSDDDSDNGSGKDSDDDSDNGSGKDSDDDSDSGSGKDSDDDSDSGSGKDSDDDSDSGSDKDSDDDSDSDSDKDSDSKSGNRKSNSNSAAKTGDNSPIGMVMTILFIALGLFAVLFVIRRRRTY